MAHACFFGRRHNLCKNLSCWCCRCCGETKGPLRAHVFGGRRRSCKKPILLAWLDLQKNERVVTRACFWQLAQTIRFALLVLLVLRKKAAHYARFFFAGNTKPFKSFPFGMVGATENTKPGNTYPVGVAGAAQSKQSQCTLPATLCPLQRTFMMHAQSTRRHACCRYHS